MKPLLSRVQDRYRHAFSGLPPSVWFLALTSLVNRAGTMVVPFLSLYLTTRLGFSRLEAAEALLVFGVGGMIGSLLGGKLSDRWNPVAVQTASLVGGGALFLVLSRFESLAGVLAGLFALGVVNEAYRPAVMSAVAAVTDDRTRLRSLALLRLAINVGMTVGPAAGGFLARLDYGWLFLADGLTCWASAVLLLAIFGTGRTLRPPAGESPDEHAPSPWADGRFLAFLAAVFLFALLFFQILGAYPLYLKAAFGMDEAFVGLVFMLNGLVVVLVEMPLVGALEHRDPFRVAGAGALLAGTGFALMPLGGGPGFVFLTVVVWTLGEMLSFPFFNNLAALLSTGKRQGTAIGLYTAVFSLAFTVAPPAGLWVYDRFGAETLWTACGVLGLVVFAVCTLRVPRLHPRR